MNAIGSKLVEMSGVCKEYRMGHVKVPALRELSLISNRGIPGRRGTVRLGQEHPAQSDRLPGFAHRRLVSPARQRRSYPE